MIAGVLVVLGCCALGSILLFGLLIRSIISQEDDGTPMEWEND